MYQTKISFLAVTVLILVLIPGLGCLIGLMPAPSRQQDSVPSADIPGYMTYFDKSGIFSIDYPAGWEAERYEGRSFAWGTYAKEALNRLQQGLPVQSHYQIFKAYKRVQHEIVASVYIDARAVFWPKPYTIDDEAESKIKAFPDFKELGRTQATVDGREATIWEWEATYPEEQTPSYHLEEYLATGKGVWIVKCNGYSDNITEWQNDFNAIARSLRIYY